MNLSGTGFEEGFGGGTTFRGLSNNIGCTEDFFLEAGTEAGAGAGVGVTVAVENARTVGIVGVAETTGARAGTGVAVGIEAFFLCVAQQGTAHVIEVERFNILNQSSQQTSG
jgi:hypothetical protein